MAVSLIISISFFYAVLAFSKQNALKKENAFLNNKLFVAAILLSGFILRVFLAFNLESFAVDMTTFKAWGKLVCDVGFADTYSQGVFLDYPPGYLYILALLENIRRAFSLSFESTVFNVICKMPSMLADIACAGILYAVAKPKSGSRTALLLCCAYLFCPAVLINSAMWGQIDSFCALLLVGALLLLFNNNAGASGAIYAMAVLCKPQMLVFAPVFLIYPIFKQKYKQLLLGLLCAAGTALIIALPFGIGQEPLWLFKLYFSTFSSYAYYSVNAYNLWALINMNWFVLPSSILGNIISLTGILAAVTLCVLLLWKGRQKQGTLFLGAAAIMSVLYLMGVKMHERYIFPVLLCLLFACAVLKEIRFLRAFAALAAVNALNVAHVLNIFVKQGGEYNPNSIQVKIYSALQVAAICYVLYSIAAVIFPSIENWRKKAVLIFKKPFPKNLMQTKASFKYADFAVPAVIIVLYGFAAFWSLGSRQMAQTSWLPAQNESVTLRVQQPAKSMWYLPGIAADISGTYPRVGAQVQVETSQDGIVWTDLGTPQEDKGAVFTWNDFVLPDNTFFVRLTAQSDSVVFNEIGLRGFDNELLDIALVQGNGELLLDEQQTVVQYRTYENSMYFDEIYHARSAYEHLQGLEPYESTHPPLGKLIIAVGIKLFGMTPFGWRFMGTLCGVIMLAVFYHLIKQLFNSTLLCGVATFLFAFDFMHFTQTRIATIDTFAVFFILLMYDAMVVFIRKDLQSTPIKKLLLPLLASGVFMGLGIASKWTVAYGAIGLAVLFFAKLLYSVYLHKEMTLRKAVIKRCILLCLWCCLFFVILPFAIYFMAFLPILMLSHRTDNLWVSFWQYQNNMFDYHSQLTAQHPYSSPWYEWPFSVRPMWYYVSSPANAKGEYSTIAAFGSPLLWWPCAAAMVYAAINAVFRRCKASAIIVIGFLSVYLPWVLVPRATFIYHYFPAVPFLIAALILAARQIMQTKLMQQRLISVKGNFVTVGTGILLCYAVLNAVLFAAFYPVLSGMPVALQTVERLRLFERWYF